MRGEESQAPSRRQQGGSGQTVGRPARPGTRPPGATDSQAQPAGGGGCRGQSGGRGRKRAGAFSSQGKQSETGPTRCPAQCGGFQWLWALGPPRVVRSLPWVHLALLSPGPDLPSRLRPTSLVGWKTDREADMAVNVSKPPRKGRSVLGALGVCSALTVLAGSPGPPQTGPQPLRGQLSCPHACSNARGPSGRSWRSRPGGWLSLQTDSANVTGGCRRDNRVVSHGKDG